MIVPRVDTSSAYQTCVVDLGSLLIKGRVAMAYMDIAIGSPCVVPSWEWITSPSMNSSEGSLYVLMRKVEMAVC